ncbi:sulfatase [Luteolibacter arcticus]|uniref:Sulfatase n=1 Tax=Luteolibacter arcticus TaxID=1581411 RepID=A0ABT3GRI3_9BACT|nr:sulfatase [Luteolibacter arcticus]MCW1926140.1 sulfatase [Luteolibacter arcticus]
MKRLFLCLVLCGIAAAADRPNVLVFIVDDMGWQDTSVPFHHDAEGKPVVSVLNRRYRTPNMEKLAAQGMKFTRAYAHPVCTPSRITLMTGKNAARHHVTNWTNPAGTENSDNDVKHLRSPEGWGVKGISPDETALPSLLKQAGYRTIHCGKAHFGSKGAFGQYPQAVGFDINIAGNEIGHPASYFAKQNFGKGSNHVTGLEKWHGKDEFLTEVLTRELGEVLETSVKEKKPFFAYMAHYAVHSPFNEDPRFSANYPDLPPPQRAYATLIEGMDRSLGDLLAKLDTLGVAENTLVIFLSDNGGDAPIPNNNANPVVSGNAPIRGKKGMRYEGGIRVPMIAAWAKQGPGNAFPIPAASHTSDLVALADIFPTVTNLAGVTNAKPWDGHDLLPYLKGDPSYHRPQWLVTHYPHGHNNDHYSIFHEGPWKLIRNWADGSSELYNLASDLAESKNLAAEQPDRTKAMAAKLDQRLNEYGALRSKVVGP